MLKKRVLPVFIIAFALLGVMLISGLSLFNASAAEQVTTVSGEDKFDITADGDDKTVNGIRDGVISEGESFNLVIPEGVTAISSLAFDNTGVVSVSFPASVKSIGANAFENCAELTEVNFADGVSGVTFDTYSFTHCPALTKINLPAQSTVRSYAFSSCANLLWIYADSGVEFINNGESGAPFFLNAADFKLIFADKNDYDKAVALGSDFEVGVEHKVEKATYLITVKRHIGSTSTVIEDTRLYNRDYSYVSNGQYGEWSVNSDITDLPAQAAHYASTKWYSDEALTTQVTFADINAKLRESSGQVINLYCHDTVNKPSLPAEPAAWVYDSKVSYDTKDLKSVLKAMGCTTEYTDAQLSALKFEIKYTDSDAKEKALPAAICNEGVYGVTVSLDPSYGVWRENTVSTVTVNVDKGPFNTVLIILIIAGALALAVTVTTAVIRKKVQANAKRKQISQKEVLEKFRASGGETTLQ